MKQFIVTAAVISLLAGGCSDATTRLLKGEDFELQREIVDVAKEKQVVTQRFERSEQLLTDHLVKVGDPRNREMIKEKLRSLRYDRESILALLDSFDADRGPTGRILLVRSTNAPETCYLLVRDGAIVDRGGTEIRGEWD